MATFCGVLCWLFTCSSKEGTGIENTSETVPALSGSSPRSLLHPASKPCIRKNKAEGNLSLELYRYKRDQHKTLQIAKIACFEQITTGKANVFYIELKCNYSLRCLAIAFGKLICEQALFWFHLVKNP